MAQFKVLQIDWEKDRTLLYGHPKWPDYHVIAPTNIEVKLGDTISYDPEGYNFGWFKALIQE